MSENPGRPGCVLWARVLIRQEFAPYDLVRAAAENEGRPVAFLNQQGPGRRRTKPKVNYP